MSKKFLLVSLIVVLVGGFIVYEKFFTSQQAPAAVLNTPQTQTSGQGNPPVQPVTPAVVATALKDGTYIFVAKQVTPEIAFEDLYNDFKKILSRAGTISL